MNRDDIISMARDAGISVTTIKAVAAIKAFALLVAAAEREECANVCEETTAAWTEHVYNRACVDCAAAIRARGNHD